MGSNDIFQQKMIAQTRENEKNAEKSEGGNKKPNLLKRVGKSLQRIVEAPLHVVGGVLEATNHALHGRLDRSARSIAGGFKAGFGSLHEGIRQMPLVGDVVQKVEKTAFGIHEKMEFAKKDDSDIKNAENRLNETIKGILSKYDGTSDEDLKKEAEELRKKIMDEYKKEALTLHFSENFNEQDLDGIKPKIPGIPNYSELTNAQKDILQTRYFGNKNGKPDLEDPMVKDFFTKIIAASKENPTEKERIELRIFALNNSAPLMDKLHMTEMEKAMFQYAGNISENNRRFDGLSEKEHAERQKFTAEAYPHDTKFPPEIERLLNGLFLPHSH